jgi:hypothetical protein
VLGAYPPRPESHAAYLRIRFASADAGSTSDGSRPSSSPRNRQNSARSSSYDFLVFGEAFRSTAR